MEAFESCSHLEHGMVLDHCNYIRYCSNINPRHGGRPVIYKNYCGEKIDWKEFFALRRSLRQKFREHSCPEECRECVHTTVREWDDEDYIDYLLLTPWVPCNSRCIYCNVSKNPDIGRDTKVYKVLPLIQDMIENNIFSKDAVIDFAGGEPVIYPEFEALLNEFTVNNFKKIIIHTNAVKKSSAIIDGIKKGAVRVLVSVDAGSKEMHERIKQVKTFDIVWKNLEEYACSQPEGADNVKTKYIIVPGVNDNTDEINLWLEKSKAANIKSVVLNLDTNWITDNIEGSLEPVYNLMKYTQELSKELGMKCELYGQMYQVKCEVEKNRAANPAGF